MGFLDSILGRSTPPPADLDALFAVPQAAVSLQTQGFVPTGQGAVCYRAGEGAAFARVEQQSEQLIEQYRLENDTELTFINDACQCHESYRVGSTALYQAYKAWCDERGFKPRNMNQLAGEWRRLGFESVKSDGRMMWKGLRISERSHT